MKTEFSLYGLVRSSWVRRYTRFRRGERALVLLLVLSGVSGLATFAASHNSSIDTSATAGQGSPAATLATLNDCHVSRPANSAGSGFFVRDGGIYDPNGCRFIPMGFNTFTFWNTDGATPQKYLDAVPRMAVHGANTVRIVAVTDHPDNAWSWNANPVVQRELVEAVVSQNMVAMLEMHDATCGKPIQGVVEYWLSDEMVQLAQDYEQTMWINIANEHNFDSSDQWTEFYIGAIKQLRDRGVNNLIVLDAASDCGQSHAAFMSHGAEVLQADPERNVAFSLHLYAYWRTDLPCSDCGSWGDSGAPWSIQEEFPKLVATGLPILIGEFAWHAPASKAVPYDGQVFLEQARRYDIGLLFWTWFGDGNDGMRMVNGLSPGASLTPAGDVLVPFLQRTASKASHRPIAQH